MNTKIKNTLLFILFGIMAAVILFTCNYNPPQKPVIIPVKEQIKPIEKTEAAIKIKVDSSQGIIQALRKDNSRLTANLKQYQAANKAKAASLLHSVDTSSKQVLEAAISLIENSATADSLCNETIANHQAQITEQQKIIGLKDSLNIQIRAAFNTAMDQQRILTNYTKKLETKAKWTAAGKWGWKAAAVAGGLFILKSAIQ